MATSFRIDAGTRRWSSMMEKAENLDSRQTQVQGVNHLHHAESHRHQANELIVSSPIYFHAYF